MWKTRNAADPRGLSVCCATELKGAEMHQLSQEEVQQCDITIKILKTKKTKNLME